MEETLRSLVRLALAGKTSDIHMRVAGSGLELTFRTKGRLESLEQDIYGASLFAYLKFRAGLDLTDPSRPQTGQFEIEGISCRFSVIRNANLETGVLRLLPLRVDLPVEKLSPDRNVTEFFKQTAKRKQGLYLFAGPTGSGKTTTQHAILRRASLTEHLSCVSLEDPVEIPDESYLQVEVNEAAGFTFELGITEVLRHDPDIICIGETRSAAVLAKVFTASLTGHFTMTTIHAGDGLECIHRLLDLGIAKKRIATEVDAIISQRLVSTPDGGKEVLYEILKQEEIRALLEQDAYPAGHVPLDTRARERALSGRKGPG